MFWAAMVLIAMSVTGGGPDDQPADNPFSYIAGNYGEIVEFLEGLSEQLDLPGLVDVSKDILKMPPEERFTRSFSKFATIYGIDEDKELEEVDDGDFEEKFLSVLDNVPENFFGRFIRFTKGLVEDSIDTLANRLVSERGNERHTLILAVFLEKYYSVLKIFEEMHYQDRYEDSLAELNSIFATLNSHLVLIVIGKKEQIDEDLLRDILRADYYMSKLDHEELSYNPNKISLEEVERRVVKQGSLSAYDRLDITVSRGAELAGLPTSEFEQLLIDNGICVNYGPSDREELIEGSGLSKSR